VLVPDTRGRYPIDTPVFFDEGVIMPTFEIDGGGAELIAGANLPTTPSFGAGTTAFMFYPNTLRSALSGGVVTASDATRATGSTGCCTAFVLRNVEVTGQMPDYGITQGTDNGQVEGAFYVHGTQEGDGSTCRA